MNIKFSFFLFSLITLSACGGGGDSGQGSLSVSLADAPVDEAANVFVTIRGVSLNYEDSGWVDHDFETPELIDLLLLQSGTKINLFTDDEIDAGSYQVRLNLHSDDDNAPDQYIVIEEGGEEHELFIPSGFQTGLKLNSSIVVPSNGSADYTIDFDVRQSVVLRGNENNNNGYLLKPVLRLVDNTQATSISEVIQDTTPSLFITDCSDDDPLTHNAIYVFEGDVTPDDYGSAGAQAVTTALVNYNEVTGEYSYTTAPLLAGDYTVSFTCNSDLEVMDADDELDFKATNLVTVSTAEPDSE